MTQLEDKFNKLLQEVLEENQGKFVDVKVARGLYNGGYGNGLGDGQTFERARIIGVLKRRDKYGAVNHFIFSQIKQEINGYER